MKTISFKHYLLESSCHWFQALGPFGPIRGSIRGLLTLLLNDPKFVCCIPAKFFWKNIIILTIKSSNCCHFNQGYHFNTCYAGAVPIHTTACFCTKLFWLTALRQNEGRRGISPPPALLYNHHYSPVNFGVSATERILK